MLTFTTRLDYVSTIGRETQRAYQRTRFLKVPKDQVVNLLAGDAHSMVDGAVAVFGASVDAQ